MIFGVFRYLEEICEIPREFDALSAKIGAKIAKISVVLLAIHEHVTKICDENLLNC